MMTANDVKPALGSQVHIVIDTSHIHRYLAPDAKHRVGATETLTGVVVASPKWFADHVSIVNHVTKVTNHIPVHRIVRMNNEQVVQPAKTEDVVVNVAASKGDGVYTVRQDGVTKKWSCTCPGYTWKKTCKHVTEVKVKHESR